MKKEYLEIIFKAVSLRDIELLVFVLSKDINKDMLKSLSKITYKDNKNVYEYLLINNENEMLDVFIKFGYWAHINTPIINNETLIELAYRYKNVPILLSILSNDNINYSSSDEVFKKILNNIKRDYQVSSFLLSYIDEKIEKVSYPNILDENHLDKMDNIVIHDENESSFSTLYKDDIGEKIESFKGDTITSLKKILRKFLSNKNEVVTIDDYNKLETETENTDNNEKQINKSKIPTPEEIRSKIKFPNENVKTLLDEIEETMPEKNNNLFKQDFEIKEDINFKKEAGFIKDFKSKDNKDKIEKVTQHLLKVLSTQDLNKYATIKNFISLLNDYNINIIPKIENDKVSSVDFILDNELYHLSDFSNLTMKEIRDVLNINNQDNLYLINEKIKYFKLTETVNKEYIRLFITKSFLDSVSLVDFLNKIRNERFNIKVNIKDFDFERVDFNDVKDALTIYTYEKDDVEVDDKDLPEMIRFSQIKNKLS